MENTKTISQLLAEGEELDKRFMKLLRENGFKFNDIIEAGTKAEEVLKAIDKN